MANLIKDKVTLESVFLKGKNGKRQVIDRLMTRVRTIENIEQTLMIKGTQKTPRYQTILIQSISSIDQIDKSLKIIKKGTQLGRILKMELQHEKELWEDIEKMLYELKAKVKKRGRETEALTELHEIKPILNMIRKRVKALMAHLMQEPQEFEEAITKFYKL